MIDEVLKHLETADRFDENAKRLFEADEKAPNWLNSYNQCLRDARRERTMAREIARKRSQETVEYFNQTRRGRVKGLKSVTIGQIFRWASIIQSSSVGTSRLRRTAIHMMAVAELFEAAEALGQINWWSSDVAPVPPGRRSPILQDLSVSGSFVQIDSGSDCGIDPVHGGT